MGENTIFLSIIPCFHESKQKKLRTQQRPSRKLSLCASRVIPPCCGGGHEHTWCTLKNTRSKFRFQMQNLGCTFADTKCAYAMDNKHFHCPQVKAIVKGVECFSSTHMFNPCYHYLSSFSSCFVHLYKISNGEIPAKSIDRKQTTCFNHA